MPRMRAKCQHTPIATSHTGAHGAFFMAKPSPLDDPEHAAFAWARFRTIMRLMAWVTLAVVIASLAYLWATVGAVPIHFYIATALGIGASMMLMSALMGLVFLSNGTGHDDSVADAPDPPGD